MTILSFAIFFLILFVLVIVHEAGHFVFAKLSKMRVDEFAFGFPPRLFSFTKGETKYSFNLIPLGGFVKIYGENNLDDQDVTNKEKNLQDKNRSFDSKSGSSRVLVLLGGVIFNLFATVTFFTFSFILGTSTPISSDEARSISYTDRTVLINSISEESNLFRQGLRKGDTVISVQTQNVKLTEDTLNAEAITKLSGENSNNLINIKFISKETGLTQDIGSIPQAGIVEGRKVLGISMSDIAYQKLGFIEAFVKGVKDTYNYTVLIFTELGKLIYGSLFGSDRLQDALAGPVGLAASTRDIADRELGSIMLFAGLLSLSLAVFNILPVPALDGGRILFVLLEYPSKWIFKRKISKSIEQAFHSFGFIFLIGLMIYITYFDILKLVN